MSPFLILIIILASMGLAIVSIPIWVLFGRPLFKAMPLREKAFWAVKMAFRWPIDHFFYVMGISKRVFFRRFAIGVSIFILVGAYPLINRIRRCSRAIKAEHALQEREKAPVRALFRSNLGKESFLTGEEKDRKGVLVSAGAEIKRTYKETKDFYANLKPGTLGSSDSPKKVAGEASAERKSPVPAPRVEESPVEKVKGEPPFPAPSPTPILPLQETIERTFYDDGGLKSLGGSVNGRKEGFSTTFRRDGSILYDTIFKGGVETGTRRTYSRKGPVLSEERVVDGRVVPSKSPWLDKKWWKEQLSLTWKEWTGQSRSLYEKCVNFFRKE